MTVVEPYLFFQGRCEEALNFYTQALGAKVTMLMRFDEAPEQPPPDVLPPGNGNKVMHASFTVGRTLIMASDGCVGDEAAFKGISLSITVTEEAEARRYFNALAVGGTVTMPLEKTFWSPCFGTVTDKFGVSWMIGVAAEAPPPQGS
ncbi:MAG: VOC family protein [Rhodocyclaceae bacterium]